MFSEYGSTSGLSELGDILLIPQSGWPESETKTQAEEELFLFRLCFVFLKGGSLDAVVVVAGLPALFANARNVLGPGRGNARRVCLVSEALRY